MGDGLDALVLAGCAAVLSAAFTQSCARDIGEDVMCHQWAGKDAIVYEGKCMVRKKDGGLRPARKDGSE